MPAKEFIDRTPPRPGPGWLLGCLLCGLPLITCAAPATLTKTVLLEVVAGKFVVGRRQYPTGTPVDAVVAADGQVQVTTRDGTTALVAAALVQFAPTPTPTPTPRPAVHTPTPAALVEEGFDLVTLSGTAYRHAVFNRVEPDGVSFIIEGGMATVPFDDLPENLRRLYQRPAKKASPAPDHVTK